MRATAAVDPGTRAEARRPFRSLDPPPENAVHLRGVSRLYDGVPAVAHLRLAIDVGETIWLRGPNGSGKSTVLRLLATVVSPTFGTGSVLGHDLVAERQQIRARTEYLGHEPRTYPELTAEENLRFVCSLYGLDPHGIPTALVLTGLEDAASARTGGFSQGMVQRLALARAWLRRPDLLLLDEPYAGLDVDAHGIVDQLLVDVRSRGATAVLASHEDPPGHLLDRTILLDGGRAHAVEPDPGPRPAQDGLP